MVKYLKKIGVLSLLISIAINNNFKAMDGSEEAIKKIKDYNLLYLKSLPIIRDEEHLNDCVEVGDFKDAKQLVEWLSIFLPDDAVGRFVVLLQKNVIGYGDSICVCKKPRTFVPISKILDLMVSFIASDDAKKFFESENEEITIKSDDFGYPISVTMSKVPALISRASMEIENFFFTKLTFNKLDNDFTFIVAQIEKQPVVFIKYRNICLSNLIRKQEVSEKVVEYNGKKFKSFTIDNNFYVFSVKKPLSFENMIIEI